MILIQNAESAIEDECLLIIEKDYERVELFKYDSLIYGSSKEYTFGKKSYMYEKDFIFIEEKYKETYSTRDRCSYKTNYLPRIYFYDKIQELKKQK
jgi:hypothetical protein